MTRLAIAALIVFSFMVPAMADDMGLEQGSPQNQQEKKLVERVSSYIVKVLSEQTLHNKRSVCTGLVIGKDTVLTSALISRFGDERITVMTAGGKKLETELLGIDHNSSLALLKLKNGSLDYAKQTATVATGDPVWVMGVFYQNFPSLFQGMVSNADEQQIIINAPVIPGVSGGAVITADGSLAGIVRGRLGVAWNRDVRIRNEGTELIFPGENPMEQPLLFAMPITGAKRVAADLAEFGYYRQGWVGVWCEQLQGTRTIQITEITEASPADKVGLKAGDIILAIDNQAVQSIADLQRSIFNKRPGDPLIIQARRNETIKDYRIIVAENPQTRQFDLERTMPRPPDFENRDRFEGRGMPPPEFSSQLMRFRNAPNMGLIGTLIGKETAAKRGVKEGHGIMLKAVMPESPFRALNLMVGDVVVEVDGQPIRSMDDLEALARSLDTVHFGQGGNKKTLVRYYRDGKAQVSSIQLPAEPLREDEIRQLRNRMDQVSSILRDQQFQILNDTLQRLKERIGSEKGFQGSAELQKMEKRIEEYHRQSQERIDAEYKYLMDTISQLKKDMDK